MEVVDGAMQAVDGAIDNAKNAMDNAIHRIKKEVKLQKMKSDSMCQLKTAHNWQEVKENVEDPDAPSYFWRAHTVTVLLVLICCLVYTALIENPVEDATYNGKRGFVAALFFWVTLGMTIMPDGPFLRPHPALWRFTFAFGVFYELLLIYILFQTPVDARKLLKYIDGDLGEPIPEKDYGGNCRLYDGDNEDPWHNIKDKVDIFMVAHLAGYWCKTIIFRDWWLTTVISIMFEFLEYSLEHQLPNFSERWWDHWWKTSGRGGGLGRGGRRVEENRSRSRGRGGSLDKSGGSVELKLDTSMELLKSPKMVSTEHKEEDMKASPTHDTTTDSKEDNMNTVTSKEDAEDLAEDFSDFGDSDDEILNQEETDSREGGELRDGDSRPPSRLSQRERKRREGREGVLADIETEDANTASANESEETIKSNAKLADALGADWSQLIPKEKTQLVETGDARKRWSLVEIIRRVGLSKNLLGEDAYNNTLDKINSALPDCEKVVMLDPTAGLHCAKRARLAEQAILLTDLGGCRALSARADINIRRKLNGIRGADTGLPPPRLNTNMDLFNKAKEMLQTKAREREMVEKKVQAMLNNQKPLVC
eukprot:GFUD01040315.1.p1 GENE.GFUD01040315.1~~GFUD01040315.1.p1  ORF type:complete len:594 (+),score=209.90 GFUD01040315.1:93-1874(+)